MNGPTATCRILREKHCVSLTIGPTGNALPENINFFKAHVSQLTQGSSTDDTIIIADFDLLRMTIEDLIKPLKVEQIQQLWDQLAKVNAQQKNVTSQQAY